MIRFKFGFLLFLVFTSPAKANDILSAVSAYERGDYEIAYREFTRLALNDIPEAQYNLAFMYFGGDGVKQDDTKAAFWFEQAAKSGHAQAQDTLAYMYLNGRGLQSDRVRAYVWYRLAAENGVFLAKRVSESLKREMDKSERIHAEKMAREYSIKFNN